MKLTPIIFSYIKTKYLTKFKSRQSLEKWQDKKVKQHIKQTVSKSKFYRDYYKNHDINQWKKLPTINKKIMMNNFDDLNTVNIKKEEAFEVAFNGENSRNFSPTIDNITIGLSSGTSGHRGLFLVSEEERLMWAGTILAKTLPYSILKKQKVAFFLRANSNLYDTVKSKTIQFDFYDLLNPLDEHINNLNKNQPMVLVAPASMLLYLAKEKSKNNLKINPIKIISIAEVLDPLDESYIEKQFHQKIHQIYQCTEGFLATTCKHGTLHLNEDILVIEKEYLDKELGKFSPVITDFTRTSQPIIRYQLNDVLTEKKEPCRCGSVFTAIEQIEGRCDDIFYFYSTASKDLVLVFSDFIRRTIMYSTSSIEEYLIIQHSPDKLEISIQHCNNIDTENLIIKSFEKLSLSLNFKMPNIIFTPYSFTPSDKKLKRVERKFNLNEYETV